MRYRAVLVAYVGFKIIVNLTIVGLALLLLLLALPNNETARIERGVSVSTSATWLVISIVVRVLLSRFSRQRLRGNKRSDVRVSADGAPSDADISAWESSFNDRYGQDPLVNMISRLATGRRFDRLKETVEIQTARYKKRTTMVMPMLDAEDSPTILAVLTLRKGQIADDLEVTVNGGVHSTLSWSESQGCVLSTADALLTSLSVRYKLPINEDLVRDTKRILAAGKAQNPSKVLDALEKWCSTDSRSLESGIYSYLVSFVKQYSQSVSVFIAVFPNTVAHDRQFKIGLSATYERPLGRPQLLPLVRVALGLRRRDHAFLLERAEDARSYHFQLRAPRGLYVHEQCLHPPIKGTDDSSLIGPGTQSRSSKVVHVYIREQESGGAPTLRLNVRERPPGLLEVAAIISIGLASLIWLVGLNYDEIFPSPDSQGRRNFVSSWTTLLFGIPTLLSGWLVSRIDRDVMARISLSTVFLCAVLMVNATVAVSVVAFKSGGVQLTDEGTYTLLWLVSTEHPIWASIMISAAAHSLATSFMAVSRALRYGSVSLSLTDNHRSEHNVRSA